MKAEYARFVSSDTLAEMERAWMQKGSLQEKIRTFALKEVVVGIIDQVIDAAYEECAEQELFRTLAERKQSKAEASFRRPLEKELRNREEQRRKFDEARRREAARELKDQELRERGKLIVSRFLHESEERAHESYQRVHDARERERERAREEREREVDVHRRRVGETKALWAQRSSEMRSFITARQEEVMKQHREEFERHREVLALRERQQRAAEGSLRDFTKARLEGRQERDRRAKKEHASQQKADETFEESLRRGARAKDQFLGRQERRREAFFIDRRRTLQARPEKMAKNLNSSLGAYLAGQPMGLPRKGGKGGASSASDGLESPRRIALPAAARHLEKSYNKLAASRQRQRGSSNGKPSANGEEDAKGRERSTNGSRAPANGEEDAPSGVTTADLTRVVRRMGVECTDESTRVLAADILAEGGVGDALDQVEFIEIGLCLIT
eukprot:CAMPEP_0206218530 /NCGR_PEP_ID=MMETSP0047_2-20121206/3846_1 /ASSEMBLY_ACC=CAM_ASM_000192 /TAXON_ID=195065 /ORGANISM="Chroomonas mesostigmatica_cf, Strain CCMP1168" /LENGTH=445 /DNA_ID=CAMNT_0053641035 /DNA_START=115 /DNA_END=1449 /DNA_ORIENTATION=+